MVATRGVLPSLQELWLLLPSRALSPPALGDGPGVDARMGLDPSLVYAGAPPLPTDWEGKCRLTAEGVHDSALSEPNTDSGEQLAGEQSRLAVGVNTKRLLVREDARPLPGSNAPGDIVDTLPGDNKPSRVSAEEPPSVSMTLYDSCA